MPRSPWNTPIGAAATYQAASDPATADLITNSGTPGVNRENYSHPVFFASYTDPLCVVTDADGNTRSYRIPAGATPSGGADAHMHVVSPDGWHLHEGFAMSKTGTNAWHADYYVRTELFGNGISGGVRAYGGSAIGGLIRAPELAAGDIAHAIAVAIPRDQLKVGFVWPATSQDGTAVGTYHGNVPMGTLAAIPPSVNINGLGLTPSGLAVARAMQDFGIYVVDATSRFVIYVEPTADATLSSNIATDISVLRSALRVVTNNSFATVGGGGKRRRILAPRIVMGS